MAVPSKRIVVLISGRGSNLAAILSRQESDGLGGGHVVAVLSNKSGAPGLEHAREREIPALVVDHKSFATRLAFDKALAAAIDVQVPDLVVLAGFMRILTPWFTDHYAGRLINTHPSLLPRFPGVDAVGQALASGDGETGCTVHFVTQVVDAGPIIAQRTVPIEDEDTRETLEARVLAAEHRLLPEAIAAYCSGRLSLHPTAER